MSKRKEVKMLNIKEVVERTGIARSTVSLYCRTKRFPNASKVSTPFGEFWLIPETDLEFVKKRKPGRPSKSSNN